MSSNDRLIETIEHYKRNISRACPDNEQLTDPKKVVYCLEKLSKLPINVQLLSVTGIGRTVNELRKFEGPISEKAKILVTNWKAVVKAEEDRQPGELRTCASDVEDCEDIREVNGNHQHAESSASEKEDNTSEDEDKEDLRNIPHSDNEEEHNVGNTAQSDDEDLDKENEREEDSEEESEDERQRRLKFEEEKKAYEEYLKAKRKKALNGHVKNGENEKRNGEKGKSEEKREHKKPDEKRNGKEDSKDKHRSDKEKHRSSSDNKSSRDKHEKRNGERSRSRDNHQDNKPSSKSNSKDSQSNSKSSQSHSKSNQSNGTEKYCKEIQIKKEKIDHGYEKALEKQNGEKSSDKSSDKRKESDRKECDKNGESRGKSSREDKSDRHGKSKSSSQSSSSSKHREDRDRDQGKRKHEREASERDGKRSRAEVVVKREPVSSDEDSRSSSAREASSSRESSVSAGARSVKKEKTESSSQRDKHNSRDRGHAGGGSEPKKMKLVEATDGGFADALMSIEPTKKSSKKKSSSRKASEQEASPAAKSSRSSSPRHRSTTRSPSVHSSGSISPLDLLSGNVKLEPLEKLDIASTLPEISPDNYFKPHLYQSPSDKATMKVAAHNDLCNIMTSKNQRTKVFSGSRVTLTKVPSLYDSCIRILQENIDSLEYTGGVPYDILKPILERCSAEQLYQLEHYNPYLMEDTGTLWQFHCGRDFRGKKLQEYETWRELYLRCMLEREKKLKEVRSKVSLSKKQSVPVRTTKLAYVDSSFVKPPRQVARQQARHGTGGSSSGLTVSHPNKAEVVAKATVGAYSSSAVLGGGAAVPVAAVKPGNSGVSAGAANPLMKKKKAPLMMKALQSFKGIRKR